MKLTKGSGMPLEFEIIGPNEYGRIVPIREGVSYIGRNQTCEYALTSIGVSREAVKVESDGTKIILTAIYNRSELRVNDVPFDDSATAYPGDIVRYRQFRFKILETPEKHLDPRRCRKTPDPVSYPEYRPLLEGVLADPTDDAPRYAVADWLEQNHFSEYANFIRRQITSPDHPLHILSATISFEEACLCCEILRPWIEKFPSASHWKFRRGFVCDIDLKCPELMYHAKGLFSTFPIENIRLSDKSPIRQSNSHDGEDNYKWETDHTHVDSGEQVTNKLPIEIIEKMKNLDSSRSTYDTSGDALIALSIACIAYGKSL